MCRYSIVFLILIAGLVRAQRGYNARLYDSGTGNERQYTREIQIKQGHLKGTVVEPSKHTELPKVDRFLGLPYAAAPIGPLRFMPPGTPPHWYGVRVCDTLPPVCPQNLPVINKTVMSLARYKYMQRLLPFLQKQNEDCLYLNIYAPAYEHGDIPRKYPVMVFIHGESFEWNSGNPYDGSVLAAYGKVVVVTLNFRLGILGFMKPGIAENTPSNFGLLDQIAALQWVQDNIAEFGGDPRSVTLMGHGTGAASVNFLMISPVSRGAGQGLFHRAILMSGSALSDWALVTNPVPFTMQVADGLNCSPPKEHFDEMADCLRGKRLEEIMAFKVTGPRFMTKFGPVVDGAVVPNDPYQIMSAYKDLFSRYDLMYGLTEVESYHLLDAVSLAAGLLEKDFESMLRAYLVAHFEHSPDVAYIKTIAEYTDIRNDGSRTTGADHRDTILDILSDARVAAPLVKTANLHSVANPKSYFYVFGHNSVFGEYANMDRSISGEEIPFVFGTPVGGPKYHYIDSASKDEVALSEQLMRSWTNFAKTGNPNAPRRFEYYSSRSSSYKSFDLDWPEYDIHNQSYMNFGIPPVVGRYYRKQLMQFWNERLPHEIEIAIKEKIRGKIPFQQPPPWLHPTTQKVTSHDSIHRRVSSFPVRPVVVHPNSQNSNLKDGPVYSTTTQIIDEILPQSETEAASITMNVIITLGVLFLLINVFTFTFLYHKRDKLRSRDTKQEVDVSNTPPDLATENKTIESRSKIENTNEITTKGCNVIKMIKSSTKSEDTYEAVKIDEKESQGSSKFTPRFKLTRQFSTSTIDPHTKVRDWIAQEIVQKYSPKFLRKSKIPKNNSKSMSSNKSSKLKKKLDKPDVPSGFNNLDRVELGRDAENSPTRPVSPIYAPESGKQSLNTVSTDVSKHSGIPVGHKTGTIRKPKKVSVAIDATPAARSSSVLKQQPIELTKSLEYQNDDFKSDNSLRRSVTMDDFLDPSKVQSLLRSTSVDLEPNVPPIIESTIIKIGHSHSKSDPVQTNYKTDPNLFRTQIPLKLQSFNPQVEPTKTSDINVTSRDELDSNLIPMSPEETLLTYKRRNYPKVLPDLPSFEKNRLMCQKRRSLPPPNNLPILPPVSETTLSQPVTPTYSDGPSKFPNKTPPPPPPRISSTLGRRPINTSPITEHDVTSTLHVGPILPKKREIRKPIHVTAPPDDPNKPQPIYDNIKNVKQMAKTIISASTSQPIRRLEPKVIIKPNLSKRPSDPSITKNIPHVTPNSNINDSSHGTLQRQKSANEQSEVITEKDSHIMETKDSETKSKLPKPCFTSNKSSDKSSDSSNSTTTSSESDTGTVKRVG